MTLITIFKTTNALSTLTLNDTNTTLILAALIPGVLALIISIVNVFRINRQKKLHEVDLVNHKEDVNLSIEGIKVTLSKEIRSLKKGVNKSSRNNKPQQKSDRKEESKENEPKKKVARRRPQHSKNYRKRPGSKPGNQPNKNQSSEKK